MKPVTDPALLAALEAGGAPVGGAPVTDPGLLAQLNAALPDGAVGDVIKSGGVGLGKGALALAGTPGAIREGANAAVDWLARKLGASEETIARKNETLKKLAPVMPLGTAPTPDELQKTVEGFTGEFYKPQTRAGRYTETVSEFAPSALAGPGGIVRKLLTQAAIPGVTAERLHEAAKGTPYEPYAKVAGALLGTGVGAGANAAVTGVQNRIATGRTAGELSDIVGQPVGAGATRRLASSVEADRLTPAAAAARVDELGPEAMLLDTGRQLRGRAEAVAAQPGRAQNTVLDAVENRTGRFGEGTAARVEDTLNRGMGYSHNAVELQQGVENIVNRVARPLYQRVMEAHPVVAVPAEITSRPVIAQAMKDAEQLAKNYGEKLTATETKTLLSGPGYHIAEDVAINAKPSLKHWDYVKKALDQRIQGYYKSGGATELNSAQKADLGGLQDAKNALVRHLDEVTGGAYKEARQAMATKYELKEAYDFGRSAFNTKLLPEEFTAALADMSAAERALAQAGFRRELDRITTTTRNEGATARRVLDTNHVIQKAEALYGPQAAREIERRVGAENVFQEATQDIARNSRTAVRQELIKDTSTPSTSQIQSASIPGLMWATGRGGLNYLRQHGMERTRGQIADVLTAPAPRIEEIVDALTRLNTQRATPRGGAPGVSAVANALIASQGQR